MRLFILCSALLVGCGGAGGKFGGDKGDSSSSDEDEPSAEDDHHSMYVADAAALPTCDDAAEGWLVFLGDEQKLQACLSGEWADVVDERPTLQFSCPATDDLDPAEDREVVGALANITQFPDGDFAFSCMDRMADFNILYADGTSNVGFYRFNSKGVTAGKISCTVYYANVTYDIAANTASWKLNGSNEKVVTDCEALQ